MQDSQMRVFDIDKECASEHVRSIDDSGYTITHKLNTIHSEKPARRLSQGIPVAQMKHRSASRMSSSEKHQVNYEKKNQMDKQILQRTKKILQYK